MLKHDQDVPGARTEGWLSKVQHLVPADEHSDRRELRFEDAEASVAGRKVPLLLVSGLKRCVRRSASRWNLGNLSRASGYHNSSCASEAFCGT